MSHILKLQTLCKCGVYITINQHRDMYETCEEAINEMSKRECPPDVEEDVKQEMIRRDAIVCVQFYPDTPVGFYQIYHYDIDEAIVIAIKTINDNRQGDFHA